jgi:hypothetical protein
MPFAKSHFNIHKYGVVLAINNPFQSSHGHGAVEVMSLVTLTQHATSGGN